MTSLLKNSLDITKMTSSYRCKFLNHAYKKWLKKNEKVLDIGCGNGIITKLLKDRFCLKITGCDVKNYLVYDIPFRKINGLKLPFGENEFDDVLLNDVLHHIPFKDQEELIKIASKIGKKVLIFDAEPTIRGKIADIILNKYHYGDLNIPLSFRTVKQWQKVFKKLSLKSKVSKPKSPFWYPFSHIAFEVEKI